jgi:hypothetical protein
MADEGPFRVVNRRMRLTKSRLSQTKIMRPPRKLSLVAAVLSVVPSGCHHHEEIVVKIFPDAIDVGGTGKTVDISAIYKAAPKPHDKIIVLQPCKMTKYDRVAELIRILQEKHYRLGFAEPSEEFDHECETYYKAWR